MATNDLTQYGLGTITNTKVQDGLAELVKEAYQEAKTHKDNAGITSRLLRCLRAKRCEYEPEDAELIEDGVNVYIGLAALKQRAAESWLIDIILNNIDQLWTLEPTPEPELPEDARNAVVDALMAELPTFTSLAALRERAQVLKSVVREDVAEHAKLATRRMEQRIKDQTIEGGWANVFSEFITDITTYPTAFIRGPIVEAKPQAAWKKNKFVVENKELVCTRRISPHNAFPAPNASSGGTGNYFIEKVAYPRSDIYNLKNIDSFLESNIRQALEEYENGFEIDSMASNEVDYLQNKATGISPKKDIDVLIYNGKVEGSFLVEHNVLVEDLQGFYEAEVWVVGDYVIRAVLNPNPVGTRPIYSCSYELIPDSIWGKGVIDIVYDTMRICNAACRAIVRNMGYASGPMGEVVSERLAEGEDVTDLRPYRIFEVSPDMSGSGAPAFRWHNVSVVTNDLLAVFDKYSKIADDLSGVPSYVLGNPQVAGAGRTLGGLSMLMGNAAKGIKHVQLNIDKYVITSVITAYYIYNMVTSDDLGIKGDAKVVARGATGLLQRELAQTRTIEILQLLTPYAQAGLIEKDVLIFILHEILRNTGMDIDKVLPNPAKSMEWNDLVRLIGGQAAAMETGTSNPQPLPPQSMPAANMPPPFPTPVNLAQGA